MSETTSLALDLYIATVDRAVGDPAVVEELLALFDPGATVDLAGVPLVGASAIRTLYEDYVRVHARTTHYWNTRTLPDGRQRADWVCAARLVDGGLLTATGVEDAVVGPDGRIIELRNRLVENRAVDRMSPRGSHA